MNRISWGIIGCGDVTEIKSGPAFNKVPRSVLVAVMRRSASAAEDYARRHQVPKWYADARELINDPDINAVYIATPPSSHAAYAGMALRAGKYVYVEKPMALNYLEALKLNGLVRKYKGKFCVAHYRRAQTQFLKIKELLDKEVIGKVKMATLRFFRKNMLPAQLDIDKYAWRINPEISGGGLFHDIAPHQLDLLYYFFGKVKQVNGITAATNSLYASADIISGNIQFENGVLFNGVWCFDIGENSLQDICEITGEKGKIVFSFFDNQDVEIHLDRQIRTLHFEKPVHVQQPMIEKVVRYFLQEGPNPCSVEEGVHSMWLLDKITNT